MSRLVTKPTKWLCAQRRLRSVWSESSLCAQWVAKDPSFLNVDSEDSDQTGRMPRLIGVFAGRTCHFVGFVTRRLSYVLSLAARLVKNKNSSVCVALQAVPFFFWVIKGKLNGSPTSDIINRSFWFVDYSEERTRLDNLKRSSFQLVHGCRELN